VPIEKEGVTGLVVPNPDITKLLKYEDDPSLIFWESSPAMPLSLLEMISDIYQSR
jgi:hypothetical protein